MHTFIVVEDIQEFVQFKCTKCEQVINFVKESYGEPNPIWDNTNNTWVTPTTVGDYLEPCQ
jgi:hypothetical protein